VQIGAVAAVIGWLRSEQQLDTAQLLNYESFYTQNKVNNRKVFPVRVIKRCRGSGVALSLILELGNIRRLEVSITPGSQAARSVVHLLILPEYEVWTIHTMAQTFGWHIS
jgi:hypothetical protein